MKMYRCLVLTAVSALGIGIYILIFCQQARSEDEWRHCAEPRLHSAWLFSLCLVLHGLLWNLAIALHVK